MGDDDADVKKRDAMTTLSKRDDDDDVKKETR
jgi:hypothetical protein